MRVLSTFPSATESCYALGVEPIAVSQACDFPPPARTRPVVDELLAASEDGEGEDSVDVGDGDHYEIDLDLLAHLDPDLVVTQSVCSVCAVDADRIRRAVAQVDVDPKILTLDARRLADVLACVDELGAALGRERRAAALRRQCEASRAAVERATAGADRPSVVGIEWLDPIHVAENWVPDLVEAAGGRYPLGTPGARSSATAWEDVREADPDALVVAPCGYDAATTEAKLDALRERPGWDALTAVRTGRVHGFDGNILNRFSPRLFGELERLALCLHPEAFGVEPGATDGPLRRSLS